MATRSAMLPKRFAARAHRWDARLIGSREGLQSLSPGRGRRWPFEHICALLRQLIKHSPSDFG